ncbi:MAG: hypothetical protein JKY50_12710 [Oleispira sp.]|nr:hypothetical protein [Oleispira sp.]
MGAVQVTGRSTMTNYKEVFQLSVLIKIILYPIFFLIIAIVGYVLFLWASTIHDSVNEGSKYGFTIGNSQYQTYLNVMELKDDYPNLVIYTYVPSTSGGNEIHLKLEHDFKIIKIHEQWRVYFKGDGEYSNSIRLNFINDKLNYFYRHRQYY